MTAKPMHTADIINKVFGQFVVHLCIGAAAAGLHEQHTIRRLPVVSIIQSHQWPLISHGVAVMVCV